MIKFRGALQIEYIPGPGVWRTLAPMSAETDYGLVTVKEGFVTDLTSGAPEGRHTRAAVFHDRLYGKPTTPFLIMSQGGGWPLSRKRCDRLFHEMMLVDGVSPFGARLRYIAVRAFGCLAWNEYRRTE